MGREKWRMFYLNDEHSPTRFVEGLLLVLLIFPYSGISSLDIPLSRVSVSFYQLHLVYLG